MRPFLPKKHQKFLNRTQNMINLMGSCNQLFQIPLLLNRQHSQAQSIPHSTAARGSCDTQTETGEHWGTPRASEELWWRTAGAQRDTKELEYSGFEFSLQRIPVGRRTFSNRLSFSLFVKDSYSPLWFVWHKYSNQNCIRFWLQAGDRVAVSTPRWDCSLPPSYSSAPTYCSA